jgi:hypothetical protein
MAAFAAVNFAFGSRGPLHRSRWIPNAGGMEVLGESFRGVVEHVLSNAQFVGELYVRAAVGP